MNVDKKYNLIALSVWLCVGDLGSVIGSNLISFVSQWMCPSHDEYVCTSTQHNYTDWLNF